MRTFKRVLLLALVFEMMCTSMPAIALDFSSVSIDPNDVQNFEQSYEAWVQTIAQNIIPSQKPTVLVEMIYTQSPERLQTYSELKSTQHLPGLPDVMDPHLSHPSESPVSALVESRKIKVIFERALTAPQEKVLAEVMNSKLHINAASGDQLLLSTLESAPEPQSSRTKDPKFILNVVIGCLVLAAILARSRKTKIVADAEVVAAAPAAVKRTVTPPTAPIKPFKFSEEDRSVMNRLMQVDSSLLSKTSSIVSPTQIILKSEPKAVIRVLRSEKNQVIAQAISGSSILFQKTVISICTSRQRNEIREILESKRFKKEETLFAQNLIAAKIYRELQSLAVQSVDQYVKARESLKTEKNVLNQIRMNLTQAKTAVNVSTESERNPEVPL